MNTCIKHLALVGLCLLVSCNREQIENLTAQSQQHESSINTVNEQMAAIKATLGELEEVDQSLEEAIKSLGEEDSAIKDALSAQKEALKEQIASLDSYVKQELANNKNWVSATFATLEQYNALSATVATLGESLSILNGKVDAIKAELLAKISGDISALESSMKAWVNEKLAGYYTIAQLDAKLAALETAIEAGDQANAAEIKALKTALTQQKTEITAAYQGAIAKAIGDYNGVITQKIADEISAVNTKISALETRISALETGVAAIEEKIKNIFTAIDQLDAKLLALSSTVKEGDEANAAEIENLRAALQAQKEELTSAYQDAIAKAISDYSGVINKKIADEISAVSDRITQEVATITAKIIEIEARLTLIESNIATINGQITGINSTLTTLKSTAQSLQEAIDALGAEDTAIRTALSAQKDELEAKIAALETYVRQSLSANKDWAKATFSTLSQFNALSDLVATLQETLAGLSESIDVVKAQEVLDKVAGDMAALEASMKLWVNEQLTGYYTIAQMDAKLAALAASISNGDSANAKEIANLRDALAQQKTEITGAYQAAISSAINDNNGVINERIANEVAALNARITQEVETINAKISALEARIIALENELAEVLGMIQSITVIPTYSDGSVGIMKEGLVDINFEIKPFNAAQRLKDIPLSAFSVNAVYTQTKSAVEFIPLTVTSASYLEGIITLSVKGENLATDFYVGKISANARLCIEEGYNSATSSFFPLTPNGIVAVDMGLSVKWGNANLGAIRAEDYGDYYAWGETVIKEDYSEATYKWYSWNNGSFKPTKYWLTSSLSGSGDSKDVLDMEDDSANIKLGGKWRIPTDAEWSELITGCVWQKTTMANIYGKTISGYKVTSKTTGNSIFFPLSGGIKGYTLSGVEYSVSYWSSTLYFDPNYYCREAKCCSMIFSNNKYYCDVKSRVEGLPIRPVCE